MPRSATEPHHAPTSPVAERQNSALGAMLTIAGAIGVIAAVALLVEKMALLANPNYIPSCNLNPVLSCGSVMTTPQAEAFGIPNPIIGVAGFSVIAVIGAGLFAGARYATWFWGATQIGVTFAVVFVHWLIYQSLYVIGALCPYCMIVWAVTIPIFWYVTVRNLQAFGTSRRLVTVATDYRGAIITGWFLIILALIAARFWDYWTSLI